MMFLITLRGRNTLIKDRHPNGNPTLSETAKIVKNRIHKHWPGSTWQTLRKRQNFAEIVLDMVGSAAYLEYIRKWARYRLDSGIFATVRDILPEGSTPHAALESALKPAGIGFWAAMQHVGMPFAFERTEVIAPRMVGYRQSMENRYACNFCRS